MDQTKTDGAATAVRSSETGTCQNTDRHLWPITSEEPFAPLLFVTAGGSIGINVGGHVIVKPLESWHELARCFGDRTDEATSKDGA